MPWRQPGTPQAATGIKTEYLQNIAHQLSTPLFHDVSMNPFATFSSDRSMHTLKIPSWCKPRVLGPDSNTGEKQDQNMQSILKEHWF